jgi:hypothetical protein
VVASIVQRSESCVAHTAAPDVITRAPGTPSEQRTQLAGLATSTSVLLTTILLICSFFLLSIKARDGISNIAASPNLDPREEAPVSVLSFLCLHHNNVDKQAHHPCPWHVWQHVWHPRYFTCKPTAVFKREAAVLPQLGKTGYFGRSRACARRPKTRLHPVAKRRHA